MPTTTKDRPNEFQHLSISTDTIKLDLVPELGGKILSLIDPTNGVDWMWSPPDQRGLFRNKITDPFIAGPLAGADECFPTIAPCRWQGRDLPDHGDLWAVPWQVLAHTESEIDLQVRPPVSPFEFRRRIALERNSAHFTYTVRNAGRKDESFLWAFHPMLHYDAGDRLEVPATSARIDSQINTPFGGRGDRIKLPEPLPGVRLDRLDFGPLKSAAVKYFTDTLEAGRVALVRPKLKRRLIFEFDLKEINTVGVWINGGGWADYRHVIIEPGIGAPDPLDVAADWKRCGRIKAGQTQTWRMSLRLESIVPPSRGIASNICTDHAGGQAPGDARYV